MIRCFFLALLLCGCAHPRNAVSPISTFAVRETVDSAAFAARNAARQAAAARTALRVAQAKSRELLTAAGSAVHPLAEDLHAALEESQTAMDGVQERLQETESALSESSDQVAALQKRTAEEARAMAAAQEETSRMRAARDFWRAAAWKLALLALALGVWTFRKPLLALCGL